jgi:threonylcarbamoyladenosine tRNA methylthiotransferase MtaB
MRRMYNLSGFMEMVGTFRSEHPDFNFTTDIIVGFPGETDHDFEATCRVAEEVGFSHIHTFRYSKRKGTRAERMEAQVPEKVKAERSRIIRDISLKNRKRYYDSMTGKIQTVLVERIRDTGYAEGYGEHYIRVSFNRPSALINTFHTVKIGKENLVKKTGGTEEF